MTAAASSCQATRGSALYRRGPATSAHTVPTPITAHGLIFITNAHGKMAPIYAVKPTASGDITMPKDTTSSGAVAWFISLFYKSLYVEALLNEQNEGYHMLMFENNTNMPTEFAATAWTKSITCGQLTPQAIDAMREFRKAYTDKGPEFIP